MLKSLSSLSEEITNGAIMDCFASATSHIFLFASVIKVNNRNQKSEFKTPHLNSETFPTCSRQKKKNEKKVHDKNNYGQLFALHFVTNLTLLNFYKTLHIIQSPSNPPGIEKKKKNYIKNIISPLSKYTPLHN